MPSEIERTTAQARRQIIEREAPYQAAMADVYERTIRNLETDLLLLQMRIEQAIASGEAVHPDWLRRQQRYTQLLLDAEREFDRFADDAARIVNGAQVSAVRGGAAAAWELADAAGIDSAAAGRINTRAVESAMATLKTGPVRRSLARYGDEYAQTVTDTLLDGIARGRSPRAVIRDISRQMRAPVHQARLESLVRTESMRAYRSSLNEQYKTMGKAISGYRWSAAKSVRTCLACLAQDGKVRPEPWDAFHVNDRCINTPVPRGSTYQYQTGEDWLRTQPPEKQRKMFPTTDAWRAWQDGTVGLSDFVGRHRDRVWGQSIYQRSGRDVIKRSGWQPVAEVTPSQETTKAAERLYKRAAKAEPGVTRDLRTIETRIDGELNRPFKLANGETVYPLDARLKTVNSTARKIATDANEKGISIEQASGAIKDNLRYTYTVAEDGYGRSVSTVLSGLDEMGYERVAVKNFWKNDDGYTSVHAIYRTPDGQFFEVQFHTDRTLETKELISHPLYEEQRKLQPGSVEWEEYQDQVNDAWQTIRDTPPNLAGAP